MKQNLVNSMIDLGNKLADGMTDLEKENQGGDWTGKEIDLYLVRHDRMVKQMGLPPVEADELAARLLYRDRPESGDDRRICLECQNFSVKEGKRCKTFQLKPVWSVLMRCDEFSAKGFLPKEQRK